MNRLDRPRPLQLSQRRDACRRQSVPIVIVKAKCADGACDVVTVILIVSILKISTADHPACVGGRTTPSSHACASDLVVAQVAHATAIPRCLHSHSAACPWEPARKCRPYVQCSGSPLRCAVDYRFPTASGPLVLGVQDQEVRDQDPLQSNCGSSVGPVYLHRYHISTLSSTTRPVAVSYLDHAT
jgi:hypothetical protein